MALISDKRGWFLVTIAAWAAAMAFFWHSPLIAPVKVFVVLLHEISHGLATIATGGRIEELVISPEQGGHCLCATTSPPAAFVAISAGYLGSLLWGGLMVWGAEKFPRGSALLTMVIALTVGTLFVLYSGSGFSLGFGLASAAVLFAIGGSGLVLPGPNRLALSLLGFTSCLYAVWDIKSDVLDRPELQSDARALAELTGIPTLAWGVLWIGLALLFCVRLLRWVWRRRA